MKRLLSICILISCSTAQANDKVAGWQLAWDNDVWAKGKTDRWYTNGLRLTWTYDKPARNELSRLVLRGSEWFMWHGSTPTPSYTIGQTMYTPRDIRLSVPPIDDRPWGSFLYFGVTASQSIRSAEFLGSVNANREEQRQRWGTFALHSDLD